MKLIFKLLFTFSFMICSANENPKLQDYRKYILTLNQSKYYSTSIAANKYRELFNNERITIKDSAFVIFEIFYDNVQTKVNELHSIDETDYFTFISPDNNQKIPDLILNYKNNLIENGFDIAISEGGTWIKKDRNFISKNFYDFISPEMKEYCTFLNIVEKEETLDDGALTITPTRLAERIIWLENFNNSNPTFISINNVNEYYRRFLYFLLKGSDNTDILDMKDIINQNFSDAYDFITLENSKSKTSNYVLPFYQFLKNKQKTEADYLIEKYNREGIIER
ncbi:hypothetical protein [Flavobacterium sp. 7A]|uniref:hypothetical protein n=1 Tax=Flavobacterium sp. 7A TaxID=2940571 RepID=UPI002226190F|nr:hypothetical protein [Flavobacterium sp. 7A]MCW2119559.1 hypothetical protein [Flavobacterium sp. 7A]